MKNTIRNFRSAFIKLFCLSCVLIVSLPKVNGKSDDGINLFVDSPEANNISKSAFYNNSNQPESFSDTGKYFIVLKNNRNCIDCFRSINDYARELKVKFNAEFIVIALIDSTTLDRKRNYSSNKSLMPDFDKYCFQYRKSASQTIFEKLGTNYTPEIILINNGTTIHISYQDIFEYQSMNISAKTQFEIINFLK